jgi:hypothetical protein
MVVIPLVSRTVNADQRASSTSSKSADVIRDGRRVYNEKYFIQIGGFHLF